MPRAFRSARDTPSAQGALTTQASRVWVLGNPGKRTGGLLSNLLARNGAGEKGFTPRFVKLFSALRVAARSGSINYIVDYRSRDPATRGEFGPPLSEVAGRGGELKDGSPQMPSTPHLHIPSQSSPGSQRLFVHFCGTCQSAPCRLSEVS